MTYNDLNKQIKSQEYMRAYLFYGEESFVKKRMLDRLCSAVVAPEMAEMNVTRFDETAYADEIIAACETLPLFSDKRVVVYTDCPMLMGKGKDMGAERLLAYLDDLPEYTVLIFYMRQKQDGRKPLFKQLKKHGAVEFKQLSEREIYSWLKADLARQGYGITPQACDRLIYRVGRDMGTIVAEIEKAQAYIYPNTNIDETTIEQLGSYTIEEDVFKMVDHAINGNFKESARRLDDILSNGNAIQSVFGAVNYRLQSLLNARVLLDSGLSASAAAAKMKGPKFAANRTLAQAKKFSKQGLENCVTMLAEADYKIKSGQMSDRAALEYALVNGLSNQS